VRARKNGVIPELMVQFDDKKTKMS